MIFTNLISGLNSASNEIFTSIFISKFNFSGGLTETAEDCVVATVDCVVVDLVVD